MNSHIINMFLTALILSTSFHVMYYDKRRHPWHHHFWLYFGILFVGGLGLAWFFLQTEPTGYYN